GEHALARRRAFLRRALHSSDRVHLVARAVRRTEAGLQRIPLRPGVRRRHRAPDSPQKKEGMSETDDDLDAIVSELNAGPPAAEASRTRSQAAPAAAGDDIQTARLRDWLDHVVRRDASDLLLVAGAPP